MFNGFLFSRFFFVCVIEMFLYFMFGVVMNIICMLKGVLYYIIFVFLLCFLKCDLKFLDILLIYFVNYLMFLLFFGM